MAKCCIDTQTAIPAYSTGMKTNKSPAPSGDAAPAEVLASPAETRENLLKVTGRGYTVVRHILRQHPDDVADRTSVLGPMVTERKRRSLQLYLLLLTMWGWLESQDEPITSAVWARALSTAKGRRWTPSNVSGAWTDLEHRGLIERRRVQHGLVVALRREDGKAAYTKPGRVKGDRRETYFVLPAEFWTDEWFETLSLPGLALLLIIAGETSDKDEVWLTNADAAKWYGLSPRSIEAGIEDLREHGLLHERVEWIKAPLSAIGATKRHWYSLTGSFSYSARAEAQDAARAELEARTKSRTRRKGAKASTKATITKSATGAKKTTGAKKSASTRKSIVKKSNAKPTSGNSRSRRARGAP